MKRIALVLGAALLLTPAALADKPSEPGKQSQTASQGSKAVVAKLAGADSMRGNVVVRLNASKKSVCWSFSNLKLGTKKAFAAHIHAKAGGAIVLPLGATPMTRRGCSTNADWADEIAAVLAKPANYYVNVHEEAGLAVLVTGALKKGAPAAS